MAPKTRVDTEKLRAEAVDAIRTYLRSTTGNPGADWEASKAAAEAVRAAFAADTGCTVRWLAETTGVPALMLVEWIHDPDIKARELRLERHHAREYQRQVTLAMAQYAHHRIAEEGDSKSLVCERLKIARTTLDEWLLPSNGQEGPAA